MLYVIATPIGNLEDITLRAIRILKEVDAVFCEDTRVTKKLLDHYSISTPLYRYDEHSHDRQSQEIIRLLEDGKHIALVSDAGTPNISDPGFRLIALTRSTLPNMSIIPIPGPSALTAALSVSGVSASEFIFLGFLPSKKGRRKIFTEINESKRPIVFYESPHRLIKTLTELKEMLASDRTVSVFRELTKIYEQVVRGTAEEVLSYFQNNPDHVKGEIVIVVDID